MPLFRTEAVVHAGERLYGTIILIRPLSFTWMTLLLTGIILSIFLFFLCFSYTRKMPIAGMLLPERGLIRILPGQSGIITALKIKEGQWVQEGEVLFVLSNERISATRGNAEQAMTTSLQAQRENLILEQQVLSLQAQQKRSVLESKIVELAKEVAHIQQQIDLQQQRVALTKISLQRHHELASFVSAERLQDKQAELIDQQLRFTELQRIRAATLREQDSNRAELQTIATQKQRDHSTIQRVIDSLEQALNENEAKRHFWVRAPQAGTVSGITAQVGQTVATNQVLANLSAGGSLLEAELYAPSRAAGFIQPGMRVFIRYQAYPYQKFGQFEGKVREITQSALRPEELSFAGFVQPNHTEALYRIKVKLDQQSINAYGRTQPLKPGMALDASILLERRKLYEWVLQPLYSMTGR